MYRQLTAADFRSFHGLPPDYQVDGVLVVGTYKITAEVARLRRVLAAAHPGAVMRRHERDFFRPGLDIELGGKRFWFFVVYGGTLLSEYLHIGCMLGSRLNILTGTCGGLGQGVRPGDIILPTAAASDGSSCYMYDRRHRRMQPSDTALRRALRDDLAAQGYRVMEGRTVTCQAILAETCEDVTAWRGRGYMGVEMEASTVFAVSSHFGVPSAAVLSVADDIIARGDAAARPPVRGGTDCEHIRDAQLAAALRQLVAATASRPAAAIMKQR